MELGIKLFNLGEETITVLLQWFHVFRNGIYCNNIPNMTELVARETPPLTRTLSPSPPPPPQIKKSGYATEEHRGLDNPCSNSKCT